MALVCHLFFFPPFLETVSQYVVLTGHSCADQGDFQLVAPAAQGWNYRPQAAIPICCLCPQKSLWSAPSCSTERLQSTHHLLQLCSAATLSTLTFLTVLLSEPPEGPTSSGSISLRMHPSSGPLHTVFSFGNTLISCLFSLVNFSSSFRVCCLLQEVCQVLLRRAPAYAWPALLG